MTQLLRRLSNVSLAKFATWVKSPTMYEVTVRGPRVTSDMSALQSLFPESTPQEIRTVLLDLLRNQAFYAALNSAMVQARQRLVQWASWTDFLYVAIRLARPSIMVETGVFDGQSTAIILQALTDNDYGRLISIDFPATESVHGSTNCMQETRLPPGHDAGWLVPDSLLERHQLEIGDSRKLLPELLRSLGSIDGFFHDSLHTFDHMTFEYQTAWPYLRDGGLLLSDDIQWNAAYYKFCKQQNHSYVFVGGRLGATKK